jgi:protein involved in polysaccharide export with SLBB domain
MKNGIAIAQGLAVVTALALSATPSAAQDPLDAGQLYATRAELQAMLAKFEDARGAAVYSDRIRAIASDEASLIRLRLRDGDFEVGDVITLTVAGQATLSAEFTVAPGRVLILPEIGAMPLTGLLRSELPDSARAFIARYIKNPQVYVQSSMRIQAVGEIGQPGYHSVSAEARLPDVIALLGQPTRGAKLEDMKIRRGKETIWDGDALQDAIVQGRTLDQLSLRAGDIIEIPEIPTRNIGQMIRGLYYLVPLSLALLRLF